MFNSLMLLFWETDIERESERDRKRERQTDRQGQTDRHTHTQIERGGISTLDNFNHLSRNNLVTGPRGMNLA